MIELFIIVFHSTSVGFLFPVYSSYKAIRANEQEAIESWLMYWVVMAGLHAVENTVEWTVNWCVYESYDFRASDSADIDPYYSYLIRLHDHLHSRLAKLGILIHWELGFLNILSTYSPQVPILL